MPLLLPTSFCLCLCTHLHFYCFCPIDSVNAGTLLKMYARSYSIHVPQTCYFFLTDLVVFLNFVFIVYNTISFIFTHCAHGVLLTSFHCLLLFFPGIVFLFYVLLLSLHIHHPSLFVSILSLLFVCTCVSPFNHLRLQILSHVNPLFLLLLVSFCLFVSPSLPSIPLPSLPASSYDSFPSSS